MIFIVSCGSYYGYFGGLGFRNKLLLLWFGSPGGLGLGAWLNPFFNE